MSNPPPKKEEYLNFIQANMAMAMKLIQEAQVAIDQLFNHTENAGATAHLPTKEEVLAKRESDVKYSPTVVATPSITTGPTEEEDHLPTPTPVTTSTFDSAADEKTESIVRSIMQIMGKTYEEAKEIVHTFQNKKVPTEAQRHAAEQLIPTAEWLPLFSGRTSVFADFLTGEIYPGGKGPIEPQYVSPKGVPFKQYTNDLIASVAQEDFASWPTGFYRTGTKHLTDGENDLQFKLNLTDGNIVILESMYAMPKFVEGTGPYRKTAMRIDSLPFPAMRDLHTEIKKTLLGLLK